jgi:hypothetical protein
LIGIDHVAFEIPHGSDVLAVANQGEGQQIEGQVGAWALDPSLDSDSVTTLFW